MNENRIPEIANPALITKVGDECVLLPNDFTDDCLVGLANETAAFIIEKIDGKQSLDEITVALCETYDVDRETALMVLDSFITSLIEQGVCKWRKV